MAKYKVRLSDGIEVGPLDRDTLRSWYEQGMVGEQSPVLPTGAKRWVLLAEAVDTRGWKPSAKTRGTGAAKQGQPAGEAPAGSGRWRAPLAGLLLLAGAAGAGFFAFFPDRWTPALRPTPWREIGLVQALLGLVLLRGWNAGRQLVRVVLVLAAFAVFPLTGILVAAGVRSGGLLVLLGAWLLATGFFFFLTPTPRSTLSSILSLLTALGGGALVGVFGHVPGHVHVQRPTLETGVSMDASRKERVAQAVQAALQEVPQLSPRAAEILLEQGAPDLAPPPEVFRRALERASAGLTGLDPDETREMDGIMSSVYGAIPSQQRERLGAYIQRVRAGSKTTPEEDGAMSVLLRDAVLGLPEAQRSRLQALYEKAIVAGTRGGS